MPIHEEDCVQDDAIKDTRERLSSLETAVELHREEYDRFHADIGGRVDEVKVSIKEAAEKANKAANASVAAASEIKNTKNQVETLSTTVETLSDRVGKVTKNVALIVGLLTGMGVIGNLGINKVKYDNGNKEDETTEIRAKIQDEAGETENGFADHSDDDPDDGV